MTYYKMLRAGIAISIEAGDYNKGLDPAIFWNDAEQNKIMVFAPELGVIEYPKDRRINSHIENMINNNDKLETYCNKHNYVIYNKESVCLGLTSYFIASAADKEKFADYCSFKEAADAACQRYTREHTQEAPETVKKALTAIIDEHGTYYNEFLKATKEI